MFVILHLFLFGIWIKWNARPLRLPVFDPLRDTGDGCFG
jgi:hypothetical protein